MKFFKFLGTRIVTFILVIMIGVTTIFFVPRFMPSDPVENMIGQMISKQSNMTPEAIQLYRESLSDTFGLEGSLGEQYVGFLKKVFITGDFGPSLAAYPTPVMDMVRRAIPWTLGLMLTSTLISWLLGNFIGLLAGFRKNKWYSKVLEGMAVFLYPIPYYVFALALIMLFCYVIPVFPLSMTLDNLAFNWSTVGTILRNSILPALSLILVGLGWWVISTKALTTSVAEEDYVNYAKLKGLSQQRIMMRYITPNVALPQITTLALQIGGVFNGALITEILFGYPGLGKLIYTGILQADYNLIMGTITISIISITIATFVVDIIYPFLDPRIRNT